MKEHIDSTSLKVYNLLSLLNPTITNGMMYNVYVYPGSEELTIAIIYKGERYSVSTDRPGQIDNEIYSLIYERLFADLFSEIIGY